MTVDPDKLRKFAATLTDDQTRLLREGLAEGGDLDPDALAATFASYENQGIFRAVAAERTVAAADAGAPDGGAGDGGTSHPPHPPTPDLPVTSW
jgi:hypothetical protein